MRWTEQQLAEHMAGKGKPVLPAPIKPTKYHAVLEECDGIKFQSKKEARYYQELKVRVFAGEVAYFLRQVPFELAGGVKYRVDFMEILNDGRIRYVDVKGFRTPTYKMKRRMVEACYPVKIEEA
uniref:DUF1064 domain-containing protein n=1 Tax=viral metagenome TaxID=1070528 RepID=A0A6H2A2D7_9ZZZZ